MISISHALASNWDVMSTSQSPLRLPMAEKIPLVNASWKAWGTSFRIICTGITSEVHPGFHDCQSIGNLKFRGCIIGNLPQDDPIYNLQPTMLQWFQTTVVCCSS